MTFETHCPRHLNNNRDSFILYDNAPVHKAAINQEFMADKRILIIHHLPYLPDLNLPDYFAFLKLKLELKGDRFESRNR